MTREEHWDGVYEARSADELSWYQEYPELSVQLIGRSGVGKADAVIDVGGGDSRLVDALVASGFEDVTVLDVSPAALERAQRRLGRKAASVEWIASDVTCWQPVRAYSLWHDRAVFHFLTDSADRRRYASVVRHAVRPGGHLIVAVFSLEGPRTCSGLDVCRYSAETLVAEVGASFSLEETLMHPHLTPAGKRQPFVYGRFRRVTGRLPGALR